MLTMRLIGVRDYSVHEDGQHIGRIRFAIGSAAGIDGAKQSFKGARLAFKAKHGSETLAAAYRAMNLRNEP
jgi:hypothetical protein